MTELSDKMIERLGDEFGADVTVPAFGDGEIRFLSILGEDVIVGFDPENAVEDIVEKAENFNEDKHVLEQIAPQIDPASLRCPLSKIKTAASIYLCTLEYVLDEIEDRRASGCSDEDLSDLFDSREAPGREDGLRINMDRGEIVFDYPGTYHMHRNIGTGERMTADDLVNAMQAEHNASNIGALICDEIGITRIGNGAPIIGLIEDSRWIHKTLNEMSNMLQEQLDLDQQECR